MNFNIFRRNRHAEVAKAIADWFGTMDVVEIDGKASKAVDLPVESADPWGAYPVSDYQYGIGLFRMQLPPSHTQEDIDATNALLAALPDYEIKALDDYLNPNTLN